MKKLEKKTSFQSTIFRVGIAKYIFCGFIVIRFITVSVDFVNTNKPQIEIFNELQICVMKCIQTL